MPECKICYEAYDLAESHRLPKMLPCAHTFCANCIGQLSKNKIGSFPCPVCKKAAPIPTRAGTTFPNNFALIEQLESANESKQVVVGYITLDQLDKFSIVVLINFLLFFSRQR